MQSHRPLCAFRACLVCFAILAGLFVSDQSHGQSITFETTPAAAIPVDDAGLPSGSAYSFPGLLVSFGFDTDSNGTIDANGIFEHAGTFVGEGTNVGFQGSAGFDTADPGYEPQLGDYFLRGPTIGGAHFGKFVIKYATALTVTAASGEIWDIDGTADQPPLTEQYRVQAFDSSNFLLGTIDSPIGNIPSATAPLDGQPWVFNFSGLSGSIDHIEVTFIGTKAGGIGLAFNNFYPLTVAPEPSTGLLALLGACLLGARRSRRES